MMPRIITIIGTRPHIIKIDPELPQDILWTSQHYDPEMSTDFFTELGIPKPKWNLGVQKLGQMIDLIVPILCENAPKIVQVVGDTNSSLAGALAAVQARIPIAHVEAGLRSGNRDMIEENNRVIIDHLSKILFAPTLDAAVNLNKEGITSGIHLVGDVMYSRLLRHLPTDRAKRGYILLTLHRAETVDHPLKMAKIVTALRESGKKFILPLHPRVKALGYKFPDNVKIIPPQPYTKMLELIAQADKVLTDSGGVQREAAWLNTPCLVMRNETEFPELLSSYHLLLVGTDTEKILNGLAKFGGATAPAIESGNAWEDIRKELWDGSTR